MSEAVAVGPDAFVERRTRSGGGAFGGRERRQFADSYDELSTEARELGEAIDAYKLMHRRRFITHEEMLAVIKGLGYHR